MAALGLEVTTADVSDELLRFAAWRAAIRRRPVRTLHLDHDSLDEEYDFITAVDVLEHLPTPVETVVRLGRHLRVGGWLFLSMPAGPSPDVPQHISFWGEQLIIDSGVREVMRFGHDCFLFEKTGPFRAHGGPPCYDPLPGAIARRALLPSVSPALWFQQTRYWYRAGRP
jgi:SAM-dependent methyltransferase